MTIRSISATTAAATAAFVMFAIWMSFEWSAARATTVTANVGAVVGSAFAVVCVALAARSVGGRQRLAWTSLAVGAAGWVVGSALLAYLHIAGTEAPRPISVIDFCHLALPIGACVAAVLTPSPPAGRFGVGVILDGLIVAPALFVLFWAFVLRHLTEVGAASGPAFTLSVVYLFVDLVAVTVGLIVVDGARRGHRRGPALVTGGLVAIAVSDAAYLHALAGGRGIGAFSTAGWAAGTYLIGLGGLAALVVRRRPGPPDTSLRHPSSVGRWLPYLPVPLAVAVGARELWPAGQTAPLLLAGVTLCTAALIRQFILLVENRRLRDTVAHMALCDPLTGLSNRTLFNDRLAHAMQLRERTGAPVAILLADLDDFKLVNDTMGHSVGDDLLRSVGERIRDAIRPGDSLARLGGDEFAILVEDSPAVAELLAEHVARAFDEPFLIDGRPVHMRLSIGLAAATGDADVSADELLKRADLAMYSAKRAHVAARSFTPDMRNDATEMNLPSQQRKTGRRGGVARIQFLGDLRRAIDERQLDLVYQPKFDLSTGAATGVEALLRWPHPEFGLLEPADFLPLVRENGLMEAVTDLVLDRAVEDATEWQRAGIDLPVAINLSAPSLNDETLPDRVMSVLSARGMPPSSLTVEITEDLLLASVVRARTVLDELRESGIRVAIDDFGTGYAAMTYLHELPVDELKLDRQFVAPIVHDERAAAIVRSVIELADTFGLSTVAEGVEDGATVAMLKSCGCGFGQGHFLSPPAPARAVRQGIAITPSGATRPSWA